MRSVSPGRFVSLCTMVTMLCAFRLGTPVGATMRFDAQEFPGHPRFCMDEDNTGHYASAYQHFPCAAYEEPWNMTADDICASPYYNCPMVETSAGPRADDAGYDPLYDDCWVLCVAQL